jgi:hypothetical protein
MLVIDWNQLLQMGVAVFGGAGLIFGTIWVFASSRSGSRKELDGLRTEVKKASDDCSKFRDELTTMRAKRDGEVAELREDVKFLKRIVGKMINRRIDNSSF